MIFPIRLSQAPTAGALLCLCLCVTNCASILKRPDSDASLTVGSQDILFVSLPELSDTAQGSLAALGWGEGRFQSELRKEIAFQFQQKGVPLTEDSASAKAWLAVRLKDYQVGDHASGYRGDAGLKTAKGERQIPIRKPNTAGKGPERPDPTMDHIRDIAASVASQARKSATANMGAGTEPQMWIIF